MEQLPKIVQNRLQARAARVGDHPDPNLLAAFTEHTLGKRERVLMMEHLAACADCRDVVALAHPGLDPSQAGFAPAPRGVWRWPVLRWGALVACVVVVGAAVSLRQRSATPERITPYTDASAVPAEPTTAGKASASPEPKKLQAQPEAQPAQEAGRNLSEQPLAKKSDQGTMTKGEIAADSAVARNQLASHMAELAAPPSRTEPAAKILDDSQASAQRSAAAPSPAAPPPANETMAADTKTAPRDEMTEVISGKAKDAEENKQRAKESGAVGGFAYSNSVASKTAALYRADATAIPRWMVSSGGVLQRSEDAGKTWQTVPVASSVVFRAVAAVGLEVWAGGAAGALYHSRDLGQHWTEVKPTADGRTLSSEIVSIEFADSQHGRLTAASGETWITADGGQSWQRK